MGTTVDQELNELKREFLAEAETKVRDMQAALSDGGDDDSLRRLGYLAHQLKGSGGSYGYERISADAAEIEKAVESAGDGALEGGLHDKVLAHISNMQIEIGERKREFGAE